MVQVECLERDLQWRESHVGVEIEQTWKEEKNEHQVTKVILKRLLSDEDQQHASACKEKEVKR